MFGSKKPNEKDVMTIGGMPVPEPPKYQAPPQQLPQFPMAQMPVQQPPPIEQKDESEQWFKDCMTQLLAGEQLIYETGNDRYKIMEESLMELRNQLGRVEDVCFRIERKIHRMENEAIESKDKIKQK